MLHLLHPTNYRKLYFYFHLPQIIFKFLLRCVLCPVCYLEVWGFPAAFLLLITGLIPLWSESKHCMIFILLSFLTCVLSSKMQSILVNVLCELSVEFSSVAQLCPTLCDPMSSSTPVLPVHHQLPEFTQTYVHQVGDAIQPSHPLSSPSPPAPNPSQHQSLFQWVNYSWIHN